MQNSRNNHHSIQPATRLASIQEYYFSKKLKEVACLDKAGKDIISLGVGSPDLPPSEEVIETLCHSAHESSSHGYQPYTGIPELRHSFSNWYKEWYNVDLDPDTEIQPLIGSKEGILHVTLAFVNPGEKVLVPNPGYPTYSSLSKLLGAEVIYYDLVEELGWMPDFNQLNQMDLSDVKLMWTNYPNMPTGANASTGLFNKLVEFAKKNGIVIVNDNPYSFILNDSPMSILSVPGAKKYCIEFNSMSKSHNMPGWRVGMIGTNATFINWILKVKSNIDSGMFRSIQVAASKALETDRFWYSNNNFEYAQRKEIAMNIATMLGCTYSKDQVGLFLWAKIPSSYRNVEELTELVLNQARVFITPGFIFGSNGERYIRLSLCCSKERLIEAQQRIEKTIKNKIQWN